MEISQTKTVPVNAKELRIHIKVCDRFEGQIYDDAGNALGKAYEGYVPSFMPGTHYGDYVILNIDLDTGQITNWKKPCAKSVEEFLESDGS